jgi:signal transduction histidine kinase
MKRLHLVSWGQLPYERKIYQLLSLYRLFAFAMATLILFLFSPAEISSDWQYLLFGLVGLYTLFKSLSPLRIYDRDSWTYFIIGGDIAACLAFLLLAGGLSGGFLLYSLCPVLTTALLLENKIARPTALFFPLILLLCHTLFSYNDTFANIQESNLITLFVTYCIICFFIPTLSQHSNISVHRHIEEEASFLERKRIARKTHDSAAQKLAYLNMKTRQLQDSLPNSNREGRRAEIAEISEVIKDIYQEVRESIDTLYAEKMPPVELFSAIRENVKAFQAETGIKIERSFPAEQPIFPPSVSLKLLQVFQEALANIKKHAGASTVWIKIAGEEESMTISVKDNGNGFSPSGGKSEAGYHGLRIMKERTVEIGGSLKIHSSPGKGTEVLIRIPIERQV